MSHFRRVDGCERADLLEVHPGGNEEERKQTPGHAVVEIVDEAGLADAREISIGERRAPENFTLGGYRPERQHTVQLRLGRDVMRRLAHQQRRKEQPRCHETYPQIERLRAQSVACSDEARCQCAAGDREVAGELVQPHREAAILRSGEIDLHDDRGRPGESLAHAEQRVGGEHPRPRRRPHQQERHRGRNDPAGHQHVLATEAVREPSCEVVRERLGDAEHDDEGEHRRPGRQMKFLLGNRWQDGSLHSHHRTYEGIDHDEQRELRQVFAQAETHGGHRRGLTQPSLRGSVAAGPGLAPCP